MKLHLYWCETEDHDEDWFIVAESEDEACGIHESAEGYDPGDTEAYCLCSIPASLPAQPGWPDRALLEALGAEFIRSSSPRIVRLKGETYQEGVMDAVIERVTLDPTKGRKRSGTGGSEQLH